MLTRRTKPLTDVVRCELNVCATHRSQDNRRCGREVNAESMFKRRNVQSATNASSRAAGSQQNKRLFHCVKVENDVKSVGPK